MKRIFLLFVIVVAVLLVVPVVIGTQAEGHYQKLIDYLKSNGAEVVSHQFRQGWFSSKAETRFAMVLPKAREGEKASSTIERFTLTSYIKHGPLTESGGGIAEIDSDLSLDDTPLFPADYPAKIQTFVDFEGNGITRLDLPAAEIAAQGKRPQMRFGGAAGELAFDGNFTTLNLNIRSSGLVMEDKGVVQLDLGGLLVASELHQGRDGLMLGSGRVEIGHLNVVDSESGELVTLKGLGVAAESRISGEKVIASATYSLELADIDGERYGPGTLGLSIDGLPVPMLVKLQQTLADLRRQQLSQSKRQLAVMGALMGSGQVLMESEPTLTIDPLQITTPEGVVAGRFSIRPVGLQLADTQDLMRLLNKLESSASLKIPESVYRQIFRRQLEMQLSATLPEGETIPDDEEWAERVDMAAVKQLERFLQQGVLVRVGEQLVTEATLEGGVLTINDKMIPLPSVTEE